MVLDLSDLLRDVLDRKDDNLIELQDEINILNKYINIKKNRFSDQLSFKIEIEKNLENVLVPNMILQPIVENATKHGYSKEHNTLTIYIKIYKKDNHLILKVENSGVLLSAKCEELCKKGTGLHNIKERLNSLYGKNHTLNMHNKNNRVIVKIEIPFQLAIAELSVDY